MSIDRTINVTDLPNIVSPLIVAPCIRFVLTSCRLFILEMLPPLDKECNVDVYTLFSMIGMLDFYGFNPCRVQYERVPVPVPVLCTAASVLT